MSPTRSSRSLVIVAIVLAAVLITVVTLLASRPDAPPVSTASPAVPAPPSIPADVPKETNAITWHDQPLPGPLATVFQDAAGADTTLAAFAGKVLVVNFWATWCAPCIKEMPTLDALQAKLGGPQFQVLAISQDREGAKVARPFIEKSGWTNIALYVEPKARFAQEAKLRGLPTTLVLDKAGREVGRLEGTIDWADAAVVEQLQRLIAQPG